MPPLQVSVWPPGPIGQSVAVVHVGTQIIPIGESLQVQPFEPGGHAFVQSEASMHDCGPIPPAPPVSPPPAPIPPVPPPPAPLPSVTPW